MKLLASLPFNDKHLRLFTKLMRSDKESPKLLHYHSQAYLQRAFGPSKRERVSEIRDLILQQRLQPLLYLCELLLLLHGDASDAVGPARQRRVTVNHFHRGAYSSRAQAGLGTAVVSAAFTFM